MVFLRDVIYRYLKACLLFASEILVLSLPHVLVVLAGSLSPQIDRRLITDFIFRSNARRDLF